MILCRAVRMSPCRAVRIGAAGEPGL
jgi:hypothetical protein